MPSSLEWASTSVMLVSELPVSGQQVAHEVDQAVREEELIADVGALLVDVVLAQIDDLDRRPLLRKAISWKRWPGVLVLKFVVSKMSELGKNVIVVPVSSVSSNCSTGPSGTPRKKP